MNYSDMHPHPSWCVACHAWHSDLSECAEIECKRKALRAKDGRATINPNHHMVREFEAEQPLSGGSNAYYKLQIGSPSSGGGAYTAECNDIIEALQMTYAEGNAFKAIWRHALARRGIGKRGNTLLYEAEKIEFFAKRLVALAK